MYYNNVLSWVIWCRNCDIGVDLFACSIEHPQSKKIWSWPAISVKWWTCRTVDDLNYETSHVYIRNEECLTALTHHKHRSSFIRSSWSTVRSNVNCTNEWCWRDTPWPEFGLWLFSVGPPAPLGARHGLCVTCCGRPVMASGWVHARSHISVVLKPLDSRHTYLPPVEPRAISDASALWELYIPSVLQIFVMVMARRVVYLWWMC